MSNNNYMSGANDGNEPLPFKAPPHSVEAEQAVLGGLMIANEHWDSVAEILSEEHFFRHDHQTIFRTMHHLATAEEPLDVVTLSDQLNNDHILEQVGGLAYLGELANNTPSAANIVAYAKIIHEKFVTRRLISASTDITEASYNPEGRSAEELVEMAERKITEIGESGPKDGGPLNINPILKGTVDKIDELFNTDETFTGVTTGFDDLNEMTSGLQNSDLIIVAARPSMGKTTFSMNLVENALLQAGVCVVVFSMEMPAEQLVMRSLASIGGINQTRVRTGKLEEEDWPKLSSAVSKLKDKPLYIDDTPALSPAEMRARLRRIQKDEGKIGMIMLDYVQLMQIKGFTEGRTAEISEISRSLKGLAKEFECPVVALSQLNRSLEQRPNKRPINSDLRESGAIEQDADIIMFIYRDEVYNEDSPDKGIAEIIIGKQRNGPIGTCRLAFQGALSRFTNLAPDYYRPDND
jgi:replicative DNA helicase